MDLDPYQVGYFITQVGLAAASFGVTTDDVTAVGEALTKLFDYRCAPPMTVVPSQGAQLQSICQDDMCPIYPNATCMGVSPAMQPLVANATLAMGEGMNSTFNGTTSGGSGSSNVTMGSGPSASSTTMSPAKQTTNAAATLGGSLAAALAAALVFAL